jgi:hypothetical protein
MTSLHRVSESTKRPLLPGAGNAASGHEGAALAKTRNWLQFANKSGESSVEQLAPGFLGQFRKLISNSSTLGKQI